MENEEEEEHMPEFGKDGKNIPDQSHDDLMDDFNRAIPPKPSPNV
jgi:hypothetical protein